MKKDNTLLTIAAILVFLVIMIAGDAMSDNPDIPCPPKNEVKKSDTAFWYYDGQVLYPDYAHDDTLVVVRANLLNKVITKDDFERTDLAISDILYVTCEPLKGRVLDLPEEYTINNNLDDLSTVITKDSISIHFK